MIIGWRSCSVGIPSGNDAEACLWWDELPPTHCRTQRRWVLTAPSLLLCAAAPPQRDPRRSPGCRWDFLLSSLLGEPREEPRTVGWPHPLSAKWRKNALKDQQSKRAEGWRRSLATHSHVWSTGSCRLCLSRVTYGMEGCRRAASGRLTLMCSRVSVSNSTSSLSISMSRG